MWYPGVLSNFMYYEERNLLKGVPYFPKCCHYDVTREAADVKNVSDQWIARRGDYVIVETEAGRSAIGLDTYTSSITPFSCLGDAIFKA